MQQVKAKHLQLGQSIVKLDWKGQAYDPMGTIVRKTEEKVSHNGQKVTMVTFHFDTDRTLTCSDSMVYGILDGEPKAKPTNKIKKSKKSSKLRLNQQTRKILEVQPLKYWG